MTTGVECRRLDFPCPSCKRAFPFSNSRVNRSLTADASIHAGFSVKTVPQGRMHELDERLGFSGSHGKSSPCRGFFDGQTIIAHGTKAVPWLRTDPSSGVLFSSYFPLAPALLGFWSRSAGSRPPCGPEPPTDLRALWAPWPTGGGCRKDLGLETSLERCLLRLSGINYRLATRSKRKFRVRTTVSAP